MLMLKVCAVAILLASGVSLGAQQAAVRADANPAAESEVKALALKLADDIVRGDWDDYARHLSSDYMHAREDGHVENKDEALAGLRDAKRKVIVMELDPADLAIRIYGDAAILSGSFTSTVRDAGQVRNHAARQTAVFVKRDGQWFLVAEQGTAIGR